MEMEEEEGEDGEPELQGEEVGEASAAGEGEVGVAQGGASQEGGAQMQHLGPGDDAERLSSSSPSSLFRLDQQSINVNVAPTVVMRLLYNNNNFEKSLMNN